MSPDRPILLGADDAGLGLLDVIAGELVDLGVPVRRSSDRGRHRTPTRSTIRTSPERVALAIRDGRSDRGILICGTGIGMAITANKVPGVRAAQAHDVYSAERARKSNNAQVLTLGARVIGPEAAKTVVRAWLASEFAGRRLDPQGRQDRRARAAAGRDTGLTARPAANDAANAAPGSAIGTERPDRGCAVPDRLARARRPDLGSADERPRPGRGHARARSSQDLGLDVGERRPGPVRPARSAQSFGEVVLGEHRGRRGRPRRGR